MMKRIYIVKSLFIASIVGVAALFLILWMSSSKEVTNTIIEKAIVQNFLLAPKFHGKNKSGQPYKLEAI